MHLHGTSTLGLHRNTAILASKNRTTPTHLKPAERMPAQQQPAATIPRSDAGMTKEKHQRTPSCVPSTLATCKSTNALPFPEIATLNPSTHVEKPVPALNPPSKQQKAPTNHAALNTIHANTHAATSVHRSSCTVQLLANSTRPRSLTNTYLTN